MSNTWILVADGARARLFELATKDAKLSEVDCFVNPDGRVHESALTTERRPLVDEGATTVRHALEAHTSLRAKSAERFARLLGEALEPGREQGRYDNLVLVAPPRFLGVLRGGLGERVCEHIRAEIHRDFTTLPGDQVRMRLPDRLFRTRVGVRAGDGLPQR